MYTVNSILLTYVSRNHVGQQNVAVIWVREMAASVYFNYNLTWDVFPVAYRQHPILTADSDCIGITMTLTMTVVCLR